MAVHHTELQGGSSLPVSGLLGMSPRGGSQNLLIDKILENGDIDQRVFSIYIDWDHMNSKISFGGYDLEKYAHPEYQALDWNTLINPLETTMWFIGFESMNMIAPYNSTSEEKKTYGNFTIPSNKILIDSGTSFNLLPWDDRTRIVDMINEMNPSFECTHGQISICHCGTSDGVDRFPDIHFNLMGKDYFIPVQDYVIYEMATGRCYNLLISIKGLDFYIMGLNFFKNYYTVFDQEHMRVGFAPSN